VVHQLYGYSSMNRAFGYEPEDAGLTPASRSS
jgi:hypothetical protein